MLYVSHSDPKLQLYDTEIRPPRIICVRHLNQPKILRILLAWPWKISPNVSIPGINYIVISSHKQSSTGKYKVSDKDTLTQILVNKRCQQKTFQVAPFIRDSERVLDFL